MKIYKNVFELTKKFQCMLKTEHRWIVWHIYFGAFFKALLPYLNLVFTTLLLNSLLQYHQKEIVFWIICMLVGNAFVGMISQYCYNKIQYYKLVSDATIDALMVQKAFVMEYEELEKKETLERVRMADQGVNSSGGTGRQIESLYLCMIDFLTVIFALFFLIELLFFKSNIAWEGILFLLFVFILSIWMGKKIHQKINDLEIHFHIENVKRNALYAYLVGSIHDYQNGKDIRLSKMQEMLLYHFDLLTTASKKIFNRFMIQAGKNQGMAAFITQVFAGICYIFMGINVLNHTMNVGEIVLYAGCITQSYSALSSFLMNIDMYIRRFEYLRLYSDFIQTPYLHYTGTLPIEKRDDKEYEFTFKNVSFHYPDSDALVLNHISMKLKVGKRYAVVGENGAGKTTFIKLLCRLYEPSEGEILLNGIDIRKYDFDEYVQIFSVVFQDFSLMALPLDENIAASKVVETEKLKSVLNKVGFNSYQNNLHQLLYHEMGDGVEVSGGEAQKIAIARALYKDAPFVILDEPTAALDPIAEAEIYENFNMMIQDKTAVFISHRMSSCRFCDEILVFDHGTMIEQGNHEELLEKEGLYYKLWHAQSQYYV